MCYSQCMKGTIPSLISIVGELLPGMKKQQRSNFVLV